MKRCEQNVDVSMDASLSARIWALYATHKVLLTIAWPFYITKCLEKSK